jgi:hypothetical protein
MTLALQEGVMNDEHSFDTNWDKTCGGVLWRHPPSSPLREPVMNFWRW